MPLDAVPVAVRRLPHAEGLPLPAYATAGAAGMDLLAAVTEPLTIAPGARALVPTGLDARTHELARSELAVQRERQLGAQIGERLSARQQRDQRCRRGFERLSRGSRA